VPPDLTLPLPLCVPRQSHGAMVAAPRADYHDRDGGVWSESTLCRRTSMRCLLATTVQVSPSWRSVTTTSNATADEAIASSVATVATNGRRLSALISTHRMSVRQESSTSTLRALSIDQEWNLPRKLCPRRKALPSGTTRQ
jgi:hypothetical protein